MCFQLITSEKNYAFVDLQTYITPLFILLKVLIKHERQKNDFTKYLLHQLVMSKNKCLYVKNMLHFEKFSLIYIIDIIYTEEFRHTDWYTYMKCLTKYLFYFDMTAVISSKPE